MKTTDYQEMTEFGPMTTHRTVEYGSNDNPVFYEESLLEKIKSLEVSVSQLKYAINQQINSLNFVNCKHKSSSYNGEAWWCYDCNKIMLVEGLAKLLLEEKG